MGTIFWIRSTKSTSNRWGGFRSPPRPRLSLQTPASDRVKNLTLFIDVNYLVSETIFPHIFSLCNKFHILCVRPDVDFGDGSPADSNLGGKQTNGAAVGSGGSSVWPPTDDRKTIKIEKIVLN